MAGLARGLKRPFGAPRPMQPTIVDHGMFIEHDMPCAVCLEGHAVYSMNAGIFAPCWECQDNGWRLAHSNKSLWQRFKLWWGKRRNRDRAAMTSTPSPVIAAESSDQPEDSAP